MLTIATVTLAQQQNITYNVIAALPANEMSVAVIVDDSIFLLSVDDSTETPGILYTGEAPIAQNGYHYAILENNNQATNASESFMRAPTQNITTFNEFFNRSTNVYETVRLPQIYPPSPSINRIQSDLHIDGQIPTMHIWGNETAVTYLHSNQLAEDVEVLLNMTY